MKRLTWLNEHEMAHRIVCEWLVKTNVFLEAKKALALEKMIATELIDIAVRGEDAGWEDAIQAYDESGGTAFDIPDTVPGRDGDLGDDGTSSVERPEPFERID